MKTSRNKLWASGHASHPRVINFRFRPLPLTVVCRVVTEVLQVLGVLGRISMVIGFLITLSPGAKAQDRAIDSLSVLIPHQKGLELTKSYLSLAVRHFRLADMKQAKIYAAKCDSLATAKGYAKENIRASILLAQIDVREKNFHEAGLKLNRALKKAKTIGSVPNQIEALRVLAILASYKENYTVVYQLLDEAIDLARKSQRYNDLETLLVTKGGYLYINKEYDKFALPLDEAASLPEKYPTITKGETVYAVYSQILMEMGELERAQKFNDKAFRAAEADGDTTRMRVRRSVASTLYRALGDYDKSIPASIDVIRWSWQMKDTVLVISTMLNLTGAYRSMGHFEKNFSVLDSAYALHHRLNKPVSEIDAYMLLHYAQLYRDVEDYQKSIQQLKLGLRLLKVPASHFEVKPWVFIRNIAAAYKMSGQLDSAFYYNDIAMREKLLPTFREIILLQRGDLFLQNDQIDSAYYYINQVHRALQLKNSTLLNDFDSPNAISIAERNNYQVDDYYRVAGNLEKKLGHYNKAIAFFETGLKLGDFWDDYGIQPLLSECYEAVGRSSDALKSLRRYLSLKDSVTHHEMAYARNEALARFRTLEKEHENALLQSDKRQQTSTIHSQHNIILYSIAGIALLALSTGFAFYNYRQKQSANLELQKQHDEIVLQKQKTEAAFRELQETEAQLIQAEKMAGLGQLIAGIAHEINNPLNFVLNGAEGIITNLEAMRKGESAPETVAEVELLTNTIRTGSMRMRAIVDSLLKISHDNTDAITELNVVENIELALVLIHASVKTRNIAIAVQVEGVPIVHGNSGEINQAFVNLLTNATQAIPEAGKIDILVKELVAEKTLEVSIRDNGTGIAAEHLSKIFDPFFTTKEVGKGTGLGLPITLKIVEKHGGTLTVRTAQGQGTEFIMRLPKEAYHFSQPK